MGYVHDTAMAQFIPPEMIGKSATATMTLKVATNVWSDDRTANDSSFTIYVPVPVPSSSDLKGCYLKSIELMYSIGTANADNIATVKLYKDTLAAGAASGSGAINTAAEITGVTVDVGHDTTAERKIIDEHRMIVTLDSPVWIDEDATYHLEVVVDNAATTVIKIFGGIINYTLRL